MRNKFLLLNGLLALFFLSSHSGVRADTLACLPETTRVEAPAAVGPAQKLNFRERLALRIIRHRWPKNSRDMEYLQPKDNNGPAIKNYNTASMVFGIAGDALLTITGWAIGAWPGAWVLLVLAVIALIAGLSLGISGLKKKQPKRGQGIAGVILSGGGLAGLLLTVLELLFLIYVLGG